MRRIPPKHGFLWIQAEQMFFISKIGSDKRFRRNIMLDPIDEGSKRGSRNTSLPRRTVCGSRSFEIAVEVS